MTNTMIRTSGLTRHFTVKKTHHHKDNVVEAVRGLDLQVQRGEMVALLGPNGAGKSTTLRMLTTLIPPTSGTAEVAGFDVTSHQREVRSRIGYIGQGNGAAHTQRGRDELISHARAYGLSKVAARERTDELICSLGLETVADRVVSAMSGGQRRRLDIAMGLISSPDLLFLDEPSSGLDPQNRANLQDHIRRLRAEHGTTVVLTTHYLDEADSLAERVVVIDQGQLIADDTPARLKGDHARDRIVLSFDSYEHTGRAVDVAAGIVEGADIEHGDGAVTIHATGGSSVVPKLIRQLDEAGVSVASVEVARPTLDDVFLHLTGHSLREDAAIDEATDHDPATDKQPEEIAA